MKRGVRKNTKRDVIANLFDDVQLPVSLTEVELDLSDSFVWSGTVVGQPGSSVSIAAHGDAVSALFSLVGHTYSIRTVDGVQEVRELDAKSYPEEIAPVVVPSERSPVRAEAIRGASDAAPVIDVLVAYTNVVREAYGSEAAVQSLVSNGISATNTAYRNSNVNAQLRLVGTMEVAYDDRSTDFTTTLSRLQKSGDGFLDDVIARRAAVGADAVSLLVYRPTDNNCGLGYLTTPNASNAAANAFNVVRADCSVDNLSLPHELGHNFGLAHDRAHSSTPPSFPYAYGYQDTASLFRDIMAYDCPMGCSRLQYFSTPDILIDGRPLGVAYTLPDAADNVRALNANVASIAAWTQTAAMTYAFTDDPLVPGVTIVRGVHIAEIRSAIDSMRARAGLPAVKWTDATLTGFAVKAVHISEMRTALGEARAALGLSVPSFTDASLAAAPVKAIHLQELRDATR